MTRLAAGLLVCLATFLAATGLDRSAGAAACTDPFPNRVRSAASAGQLVTVVAPTATSTRGSVDIWLSVDGCWTHAGGPGRGSGIFLHASTGRPTLGCVALPLPNLLTILRWLRRERKPLIAIVTAEQLVRS